MSDIDISPKRELIQTLANEYVSLFYVNLNDGHMTVFRLDGDTYDGMTPVESADNFSSYLSRYAEGICEDERKAVLAYKNLENLRTKLSQCPSFSVRVKSNCKEERYIRIHFIKGEPKGDSEFAVVGFSDITGDEDLLQYHSFLESERQKLEAKEQELIAENNAKTVFLNNMSHDIRTPMNAILGFAKIMEKEIYHPVILSDYLTKIEMAGEYLLSILNNVLDLAEIESGNLGLDEDFMDIFRDSVNIDAIFEDSLKQKNLTLIPTMNVTHRYILADSKKLGQIMVNLVSNAVKYTPDGGTIWLDFSEFPCEEEGYGRFVTTISDNGIGMSKEFQEKIFDSFTREKNTTESSVVGSGLGMAIVKQLVNMMGGTVEVESEIGKGTTFRIINVHKFMEAPEDFIEESQTGREEEFHFKGKRILLVEDNDLNAEIAVTILEGMDFAVDHANDGVECIAMLDKAPAGYYDVILMDIQMPNMDGYMATKKIRLLADKSKARIPILAMTANAFEEDKQNAVNAGMNGHIAKPIDVTILMNTLAGVLKMGEK